jgi:hypothetical protein
VLSRAHITDDCGEEREADRERAEMVRNCWCSEGSVPGWLARRNEVRLLLLLLLQIKVWRTGPRAEARDGDGAQAREQTLKRGPLRMGWPMILPGLW